MQFVRSLIRRFVTGKRLLEWETAAQSEAGRKKTSLDRYLQLSPLVSVAVALLLLVCDTAGVLIVAAPILVLWALAPAIATWLNSPPRREAGPLVRVRPRLSGRSGAADLALFFGVWGRGEPLADSRQCGGEESTSGSKALAHQSRNAVQHAASGTGARISSRSGVHAALRSPRLATYDRLEKNVGISTTGTTSRLCRLFLR